jgi:hypothetical protein
MQGSVEAIKQTQLTEQSAQERLGERFGEIQAAESGERARQADIGEARKYQTSERLAGQQFASGERLGGQQFVEQMTKQQQAFATGERTAGQAFAELMNKKQQAFATGEREASQAWTSEQQQLARDFGANQQEKQNSFARELDALQGGRWEQQFEFSKEQFAF